MNSEKRKDMRKTLFIGMMAAGIMMLGSCGGNKSQQAVYEDVVDSTTVESLVARDKTIYGLRPCDSDEFVGGAYRQWRYA